MPEDFRLALLGVLGRLKADKFHESAEIGLSEVPVGSIDYVASQPEFSASSISPEDFERAWRTASWSTRNVPGWR
ncbi:DUF6881 domain-containing protein [Streptomyces echinatus]|uniref:DUF6881 domain-containing protein n=1 Tax=Streptomyces echinatus TaxID=67293 RepID=UPI003557AFD1